jgi:hypothetical protein
MRITPPVTSQVSFSLCPPKTQVRFAAEPEKKEIVPDEWDSLASSQHEYPDNHSVQEEWEVVSGLKPVEPDDSVEVIEKPKPEDYIRWQQQQEQKELEAIGRRFAVPGRTLNALEDNTKTVSRKLIAQTKDLANSARQTLCHKTAQLLRKAAKSLDGSQES